MTPAQIVARQTADRMAHERMLLCVRACAGIPSPSLEAGAVEKAREALIKAAEALATWCALYAPDQCSDAAVAAAEKRVRDGGGTLWYIASINAAVQDALEFFTQESPTHE